MPLLQLCLHTVTIIQEIHCCADNKSLFPLNTFSVGTAVTQWLWSCATNRKVAGSIPADVTGIFH